MLWQQFINTNIYRNLLLRFLPAFEITIFPSDVILSKYISHKIIKLKNMSIQANQNDVINLENFQNIQNFDETILFDETALKIILNAYKSLSNSNWNQNKIEELIDSKLDEILLKIYDISCDYLKTLFEKFLNQQKQQPQSEIFEKTKQLGFIRLVSLLIRNMSFYSILFNQRAQSQDGIKIMLTLLKNDDLLLSLIHI